MCRSAFVLVAGGVRHARLFGAGPTAQKGCPNFVMRVVVSALHSAFGLFGPGFRGERESLMFIVGVY